MLNDVEAIRELRKTGDYMMKYGLAWGNAGNISARTDEDRYVITASGTFLGELEEDDFVECSLVEQAPTERNVKPSKEAPMHRAIYETRPEIQAVLHSSPFYSTLVACSATRLPYNWFVENMYYLEKVERVPFHPPGSEALGQAVRERAKSANILILENHGVLVYDVNPREARMVLHTLEMSCKMKLLSERLGIGMNGLQEETV
jgi:ribulose-5-phosphate 4-epimerase/fuculose-1-phosphate aldolase